MTSRRKDSIKNGEKGRKSLPLRQILWGVLTVFSLFVMLVAIRLAVGKKTGNELFTAGGHPYESATLDSFLAGGKEMVLFAKESNNGALKPDNVENKDDGTGAKQEGSKQGITESGNKESENSESGTTEPGDVNPEGSGQGITESGNKESENSESGTIGSGDVNPEGSGQEDANLEVVPSDEGEGEGEEEPDADTPVVALTFDDGPFTKVTNRIMDVLLEYEAGATFFVVGSRLEMYSDTLKRLYENGFEVASHTWSHKNLNKLTEKQITKEITRTLDGLKKYIPVENVLLRPPYGSADETVRGLAKTALINWSLDSEDWKSRDAEKIIEHVLDTVQDGDIILMHDLYECTAEAVEYLVPELIERGYRPVSVSELFRIKDIPLEEGILYRKPGDHY
ncbi:MAG: polysaccharide deacetylase family protein [Lachnospiraceae bacterium]|jgi:peptidoglycan/xylan/chitin deacetylase (PgdA/CDA1 family)|nr:polysaccharide deacetylase family protein [Lachnospiraceae bacterium]